MSDITAKVFYGYTQPATVRERIKEHYRELGHDGRDTSWEAIPTRRIHGCIGGIYGYEENLGYFLAVQDSLHTTQWDEVRPLLAEEFQVQPTWNDSLKRAIQAFGLEINGAQPSWYLVCLYF